MPSLGLALMGQIQLKSDTNTFKRMSAGSIWSFPKHNLTI